jgi:hypothetical protein
MPWPTALGVLGMARMTVAPGPPAAARAAVRPPTVLPAMTDRTGAWRAKRAMDGRMSAAFCGFVARTIRAG